MKGNIFIAIFTTALARLKLYDALDTVKDRVLYYDTDSVIYRTKPDEIKLPLGRFLGQFTDELEGDNIHEFGAAGPKSYAYVTNDRQKECKSKGLKNDHTVRKVVNCNTMLKHIKLEFINPQEKKRRLETTIYNHFVPDNKIKSVHLVDMTKIFQLNWDKRAVDRTTYITYPFGYVRL